MKVCVLKFLCVIQGLTFVREFRYGGDFTYHPSVELGKEGVRQLEEKNVERNITG